MVVVDLIHFCIFLLYVFPLCKPVLGNEFRYVTGGKNQLANKLQPGAPKSFLWKETGNDSKYLQAQPTGGRMGQWASLSLEPTGLF